MVLASTGAISFSQIMTEMGGSGAGSLSTYRANGSTKARGVTGIPVSGAISFGNFRGTTGIPVVANLIAKYSAESWNGSTLVDETGGGYNSTSTTGTITQTGNLMGNSTRKYIYGSTTAGITFPSTILPTTYTMFHIIRYNGATRFRIVDGVTGNYLSGFHSGKAGVAHHDGWVTPEADNHYNTWLMSTDQNSYYKSNQTNRTLASVGGSTSRQIAINNGAWNEKSDWAFATLLVYNTTLSNADILLMESYLMSIYDIPTISIYTWYNAFSRYNSVFTMYQSFADPDTQIQMNSISVGGATTGLYRSSQRLQDYNQVVVDFEVYISSGSGGDGMCFYMGGSGIGAAEYGPASSYSVGFQVYNGVKTPGLYLYNTATTTLASSTTMTLTNSTWTPVKIIYNKSTTNTWQVFYNGSSVITYNDSSNTSWVGSSSTYWGFGSRTGGVTGDFYIKRVSVSYQV